MSSRSEEKERREKGREGRAGIREGLCCPTSEKPSLPLLSCLLLAASLDSRLLCTATLLSLESIWPQPGRASSALPTSQFLSDLLQTLDPGSCSQILLMATDRVWSCDISHTFIINDHRHASSHLSEELGSSSSGAGPPTRLYMQPSSVLCAQKALSIFNIYGKRD